MSYTINLTNGNVFAVIPSGTINQASSMTLIGQNYAGYGQFLDDNFIRLLENGSNNTPPSAPLVGQLWFNTTSGVLEVYNGAGFKTLGGSQASSSAPTNNSVGDLWYSTTNQQLNVWTGTQWLLVGPIYNSTTGITGALPGTVVDNTSVAHTVIELYVADTIVGFISTAAAFTPQTSIPGFTTIRPGITLSTLVGNVVPLFQGTATNAQQFNGLNSTQFMRTDSNTATTGTLAVQSNSGLLVGASGDFGVSVVGTTVNLTNNDINGNINLNANVGGSQTAVLQVNGSTGVVTIPNLSGNFVANGGNISVGNITGSNGNGIGNIGNSTGYFNTLFVNNVVGGNVAVTGAVSAAGVTASGNVTGGNLLSSGIVSAASTVSGSNLLTAGFVSAAGNITGNFLFGNGSQLTGIAASYGNINVANFLANYGSNTILTTASISVGGVVNSNGNGVGNIGSSSNYFNTVFAKATSAQYADVAERFASDAEYLPGTVVELGGTAEITRSMTELSENVFGVISTNAAYLMNSGAGNNSTHPPIAMTGRVPVRVIGVVNKGDRLVSAGNGLARSANPGEASAFNVIGRSLINKVDIDEGTVEAIVTIK